MPLPHCYERQEMNTDLLLMRASDDRDDPLVSVEPPQHISNFKCMWWRLYSSLFPPEKKKGTKKNKKNTKEEFDVESEI
jgi:hypothetical protein